ncbi:methyl-accepting chemotaxis protein [Rhodobium gokarnense]|uniref:Methyl-accepting chemotaxis protein n=1 Tax=Rhodobium gokarnense TaxID=364296 RepID=A0ABT3H721_9HYPH|nr:HAMP domain-containing methyl-accepting chemotaxis protein [Rhodobium gokarnense]MCW2306189.1 methyl-accepting chemotaxis protein [Rhodobium gokarnense]
MRKSSLRRATEVCKAVANGDFEARILNITEKGDMGELMHAINLLIDRTDAYLRESKACLDYVNKNQHFRLIAERGMVGAFAGAARSINTAMAGIKQRHDSFCDLAGKFETQLQGIVQSVSAAVEDLNGAAANVTDSANSANQQSLTAAAGAEQASANMQNVAASTEQLTSSITEINRQMVLSAEVANGAVAKSAAMDAEIRGLSGASQTIGEVVSLINDIAAQTNLLALNATIEAARAGEAGRGFAIVAQEVKALAGQTATATEEISVQVNSLQAATTQAVKANEEINSAINKVSETSTAVASAVEEQSAATGEISHNIAEAASGTRDVTTSITNVQEVAQVTAQAAEKVMTSARQLADQQKSLDDLRGEMGEFLAVVTKVG